MTSNLRNRVSGDLHQVFCVYCPYSSGCWLKPGKTCEKRLATAQENAQGNALALGEEVKA